MAKKNRLFVHDCGSEIAMKTHLTLCFQAWNADASHTQNLAKLAWLRRPRLCMSIDELFAFTLWRGLRHGYVSPSPCSFRSLYDRDALPFNQLIRNFKRNSACYEQQRRNFDRIELRRRSRRKDENSKRDRRSRADSVETLRTSKTSAFKPTFDPHLCPKPQISWQRMVSVRLRQSRLCDIPIGSMSEKDAAKFDGLVADWIPQRGRMQKRIDKYLDFVEFREFLTPANWKFSNAGIRGIPLRRLLRCCRCL